MRRFLLAVAVFLTATATPTFAGYIIIRVLLEGSGVGPGGDGIPGGPGGIGPNMPGGPSLGPPGGYTGGSKGGTPGMPGIGGSKGGPPGGYAGGSKGGPPGGMPIMPGAMGSSGFGKPGASFGGTSHVGAVEQDPTRSIVVVIPLETDLLKSRMDPAKNPGLNNPEFRKFALQYYGQKLSANLFIDSTSIQFYDELLRTPGPKKTRATEMRDKYEAWQRGKTDARLLYEAMELALHSGFAKEAIAYANELVTVAEDPKLSLPERDVKPFVATWGKVGKAIAERPPQLSDAEDWKSRLNFPNIRMADRYAIVYADNPAAEVQRRAAQLNDNLAAFYLWHATQGVVLPVPQKPLVVVLAPQASTLRKLHTMLDGLPMADAFFAPEHDLLVLSPERTDEVGQTFLRQTQQMFSQGLNRDQILTGHMPKLDHTGEKGPRPEDVARASTIAAVEKLAIDEADIAAVSREGTRQLMYAAGVLPKHVTLPSWLTNGAVNFYTRPRGPAYVTVGDSEKMNMHVALTTGYGVPNYVLQRYLRDLATKKELPADSARLLENVLGDVYFSGIKDGLDPDPAPPKKPKKSTQAAQPTRPRDDGEGSGGPMRPPIGPGPMRPGLGGPGGMPGPGLPGMPGGPGMIGGPGMSSGVLSADYEDPATLLRKKQQRLAIKANATSWSLYYYLIQHKPEQLRQYVAELNKLPRDLPIDGKTAFAVFVRVFKLSTTADGVADAKELKKFADEWLTYINTVPLVGVDIPLVAPEPPKNTTPGTGPGGFPGFPGASPGGGRPGGGGNPDQN
ncbi:unnamed protein product [Gemmata massiliana]|uniref:Uncharacterized protein n=1 Tax=Gemmata massiliana TaxID=1210884 RepID=A0A6P2D750_9BACT|nr:hypothetical protein [Gemmata massiliana]VTR95260.1 unnamed protein product [Gemmata massiliana]